MDAKRVVLIGVFVLVALFVFNTFSSRSPDVCEQVAGVAEQMQGALANFDRAQQEYATEISAGLATFTEAEQREIMSGIDSKMSTMNEESTNMSFLSNICTGNDSDEAYLTKVQGTITNFENAAELLLVQLRTLVALGGGGSTE